MNFHRFSPSGLPPVSSACRSFAPATLALLMAASLFGSTRAAAAADPVKIIFDTDIESDVDDVGAVAVLNALADLGEAEILAMGVSVKHPWSTTCLSALNAYYGRPDISVGKLTGEGLDNGSKYAKVVSEEFPHTLKSVDDAPGAVSLYRKVLAGQPDHSVVMITVGFLTNFARLLDSPADEFSPLNGVELVRQKVRAWVCMGGAFPQGKEWNVFRDAASSRRAINDWPTPIVFTGGEIGNDIHTGAKLKDAPPSPVRRSYELFNNLTNRQSWDQTAVLYAVRGLNGGLAELWDVSPTGSIEIKEDGANVWHDSPNQNRSYLKRKMPPEQVAKIIEELMIRPPAKSSK